MSEVTYTPFKHCFTASDDVAHPTTIVAAERLKIDADEEHATVSCRAASFVTEAAVAATTETFVYIERESATAEEQATATRAEITRAVVTETVAAIAADTTIKRPLLRVVAVVDGTATARAALFTIDTTQDRLALTV